MEKTLVIYETQDPHAPDVNYMMVDTRTEPPYVMNTFSSYPGLDKDHFPILSRQAAFRLFDFQQGRIQDCRRL